MLAGGREMKRRDPLATIAAELLPDLDPAYLAARERLAARWSKT